MFKYIITAYIYIYLHTTATLLKMDRFFQDGSSMIFLQYVQCFQLFYPVGVAICVFLSNHFGDATSSFYFAEKMEYVL